MTILDLDALDARVKAQRENYSENFRVRIHHALSWLKQAQCSDSLDFKFISLWIALNAAYAREIREESLGDKATVKEFIQRVCAYDEDHQIYDLIWEKFSGNIRLLLDNQFIFQPFWDFHNGKISENEWKKAFVLSSSEVLYGLETKKTARILTILFQRLYTLRNQILHGGATFESSLNRTQLTYACNILAFLLPPMIEIMLNHHDKFDGWGKPFYPAVKNAG